MVFPLSFRTVTLLSSHPLCHREESRKPSSQWSHQATLSLRKSCLLTWASGTQTWNRLEGISMFNGLVVFSRQTIFLGRNRSWKAEMTLRSCSHFVHLPETIPHWPFHHPMVTQWFDGKSQGAAGLCPTLVSLVLPPYPTHPLPRPYATMVLSSSAWCAIGLCAQPLTCTGVHYEPYQVCVWAQEHLSACSRASSRDCGLLPCVRTMGGRLMWQQLIKSKVRSS